MQYLITDLRGVSSVGRMLGGQDGRGGTSFGSAGRCPVAMQKQPWDAQSPQLAPSTSLGLGKLAFALVEVPRVERDWHL